MMAVCLDLMILQWCAILLHVLSLYSAMRNIWCIMLYYLWFFSPVGFICSLWHCSIWYFISLQKCLGLCGIPLQRFFFIFGMVGWGEIIQKVSLNNATSKLKSLSVGVLQWCVLGPTAASTHCTLRSHGLMHHIFADDTEVHCPLNIADLALLLKSLNCAWQTPILRCYKIYITGLQDLWLD